MPVFTGMTYIQSENLSAFSIIPVSKDLYKVGQDSILSYSPIIQLHTYLFPPPSPTPLFHFSSNLEQEHPSNDDQRIAAFGLSNLPDLPFYASHVLHHYN